MIRKAALSDVPGILKLIKPYVEKEVILNKNREDIIERIRDYFIYEQEGQILGCTALYPGWDALGEIRTTVVEEHARGKKIGTNLVQACIEDARKLGLPKIFVLTYEIDFFRKLGFKEVDKKQLPQKIYRDCVNCKHFPNCDEIAMIMDMEGA